MTKCIPDYKKIYTDLINEKHPEKKEAFKIIFSKKDFSLLDVMTCSKMLLGKEDEDTFIFNQKLHSFDQESILKILDYQKRHKCNNTELARHFKISRNTVASWKKRFV